MNNKLIGISIVILYFANYHICEFIYPNDINYWIKLKFAFMSICLLLAFEYKKQNLLIEKIFLAIIFNDIYVLLFKNETGYTLNDIYFIAIFTAIQYVKQLYRNHSEYLIRIMAVYLSNKSKK
jgi:hypothetical protein